MIGKYALYIFLLVFATSCSQGSSTGSVIVFADVIGAYDGICGTFVSDPGMIDGGEESSISIIALDQSTAKINGGCDVFADRQLTLESTSAAKISFRTTLSVTESITLTYFSSTDSVVMQHLGWQEDADAIFVGARR